MASRPYLVFADVDETLINCKSMFDFLRYQLTIRYGADGVVDYGRLHEGFQRAAREGAAREDINRAYYAAYEGDSAATIAALGERWFTERDTAGLFIEETRRELADHRAAGAEVVLVSGSFPACLDPIARAVGAAHVLCTRPLVERGRYTGRIGTPMIGAHKADAVRDLLATRPDIDPRDCYAYGDHPSDLPMLDSVGHPVAVGDDPVLQAHLDDRARMSHQYFFTPLEPQR